MNITEYKDAVQKYLASLPSSKKSCQTITAYALVLSKFGEYLKQNSIENISHITVVNWRKSLFDSGIKVNSIKTYMQRLYTAFRWFEHMDMIKQNPVSIEELPAGERREYNLLTLDEIEKILTTKPQHRIHGDIAARSRAIIVLLLHSGLRNSELRALTLEDMDFENSTIRVTHGKGDKYRLVPFTDMAKEAVKEYLESGIRPLDLPVNAVIFGSDADKNGHSTNGKEWHEISAAGLNNMIKRYIINLTGKDVHTHLLRHAFTALCDNKGVPLRTIQTSLGHSSIRTTESVYLYVLNKQQAAQTINAAFN